MSIGVAVRIIAPLLKDKFSDPVVVCVDEALEFVVPVAGGHHGRSVGANALARSVASLLGATPVVTTASDAAAVVALDMLDGFAVSGDAATVQRHIIDGSRVLVEGEIPWPLPPAVTALDARPGAPGARIVVTDASRGDPRGSGTPGTGTALPTAYLHPPTLVIGIGASSGCPPDELERLIGGVLTTSGLSRRSVACAATIDARAGDSALAALEWPLTFYDAEALSRLSSSVPNPSDAVRDAVGTPSVCEAAALLAAGPLSTLVVEKHKAPHCTVAVARRTRAPGHLFVVGIGPGDPSHRTPQAEAAIRHAQVVVGYEPYLEMCADLLSSGQELLPFPIGEETLRCRRALDEAAAGKRVALVCSGDAGVFAMAPIVLEMDTSGCDIEIVPGVTAALAASSLLGAPLGHDHCAISLSDLTTEWSVIEQRLDAAARADLVVSLYNPRSRGRTWQLRRALEILRAHRHPSTPVGIVTDATRSGQQVATTTLGNVDEESIGMTTCVIVGSSSTRLAGRWMVTPRGKQQERTDP